MNAQDVTRDLNPVRPRTSEKIRVNAIAVIVAAGLSMNLTNADSRALRHDVMTAPVQISNRMTFNGKANMSILTPVIA